MMKQRIIIGFLCICLASMAFAQERIRIEHGPYLQNLKETETTIVWMASKPSVGWVELAPDDVHIIKKNGRSFLIQQTV